MPYDGMIALLHDDRGGGNEQRNDRRDQGRRKERADLPRQALRGQDARVAATGRRQPVAAGSSHGAGEPALDPGGAPSFEDCPRSCMGRGKRTAGIESELAFEEGREASEPAACPPEVTASGWT